MRLLFHCIALSSIYIANAGLLGNVSHPVEFFKIKVDYQNPDKIFKEFENFIQKYKRDYKTMEEKQFRFNQFVKSYNKINELNEQAKKNGFNTKYGINHFADRTPGEFSRGLSHVKPFNSSSLPKLKFNIDDNSSKRSKRQAEYPDSFDLRTIKVKGGSITGPIKNQGECGCCWAFSATVIAETANAIDTGRYRSLSDQEVCDCAKRQNNPVPGCTGGDIEDAIDYIGHYGLAAERTYRYIDGRSQVLGICQMRKKRREMNPNTIRFVGLRSNNNERSIKYQIYRNNMPVVSFFRVGESLKDYKAGVIPEEDCMKTEKEVWHSAAIIGWGTDLQKGKYLDYWLLKNSWDDDWGDYGYFKVLRGMNWCRMEENPISAMLNLGGRSFDYQDF